MLTQEQAVEVRVLVRRGGKVKQIARELGGSGSSPVTDGANLARRGDVVAHVTN
jgi:hypothetical protein